MLHRVIDYNPSLLLPGDLTRVALAVLNSGDRECILVGHSNDRRDIIGLLTREKLLQHIATVQDWENYLLEAIAIREFTICPESELSNPIKLSQFIKSSQLTHLLIADEQDKIIGVLLVKHLQQILNINQEVEEAFINRLNTEIERQQLLQQKLHTSYTQTNALLGAMSDIVFVIDLETDNLKIELPNPNLTNDAIADCLNQTLEQFYDSAHSEWFVGQVKLALKEQNTIEFEYTLLDNGNTTWFTASISPVSRYSVIWVARNISDRKRAEMALQELAAELEKRVLERTFELRQLNHNLEKKIDERTAQLQASGARFRSFFEQAAVGFAQVSLENEWLLVNQKLCEILGYSRQELIYRQCWETIHPEDVQRSRESLKQLLAGKTATVVLEKRYICKDGSTIWTNMTLSLVRDREGQPKYGVKIIEDISDRKQAEAELAKLSLVASKTDNLVVISDRHSAIEWINESFIKTTQYTLAEVRGRKPGDFLQGALTDRETVEKMRQAIQDQVPFKGEIQNYRKDGKPYWLALSINPIFNDRGELTNFIAIESDITQRKQSEQEVLKALNKEKELSRLKSDFITIASHEFRTPLTVIIAAAKLLKHYDDRLSQEQKQQQLDRLLRGCDRILRLLEDILVLGKADAGKIEFNPISIDLELFCEELLAELRLSDGDRHNFIFTYQGKPHQKVLIDEHLLHHILSNLLANALKYSPIHREIELDLQIRDRQAIFKIRDRGIGIPPEDMQHLFEAFHRAKNANDIQGTGLGLAIVKRAVDLHSGTISVESKVGEGTTFTAIVSF